jgi:hypothetical protein
MKIGFTVDGHKVRLDDVRKVHSFGDYFRCEFSNGKTFVISSVTSETKGEYVLTENDFFNLENTL